MSILRNISFPRVTTFAGSPHPMITVKRSVANSKKFKKLKEMQATMKCEDGVPIYLKKGTVDKICYRITFGLLAFGCLDCVACLSRWWPKT